MRTHRISRRSGLVGDATSFSRRVGDAGAAIFLAGAFTVPALMGTAYAGTDPCGGYILAEALTIYGGDLIPGQASTSNVLVTCADGSVLNGTASAVFTSSNTSVATVASDGTVTAKSSGVAVITATMSSTYGPLTAGTTVYVEAGYCLNVGVPCTSGQPPTFTSVPNPSVKTGDTLTTQIVKASDPDGGPLYLTDSNLPASLTFRDNGDGTATVAGHITTPPGVYNVTLTATDSQGHTSRANMQITVQRGRSA